MKRNVIYLLSVILLSQSFCMANEGFEFDPVLQGVPQHDSYNYPLPSDNSYQQQPQYQVPVNNNYNTPQQNTQNNYNYNTPPQNAQNNQNNYNYYNNYNNSVNNNNALQGNVVMVPADTKFSAVLTTPLSSESAKAGDGVSMFIGSDFYYGNHLIAPAGSRVQGTVIKAKRGGYGNRNGQIQIKFNSIVTPSGQIIPIAASIVTQDGSGILKAGTAMDTTKEYAKKAAIGAASGAVLGVVMGALSKGHVGRGAVYGTAVGGAMGLIQPVFERGGNVELPQNAQLDVILNQPITVSANSSY